MINVKPLWQVLVPVAVLTSSFNVQLKNKKILHFLTSGILPEEIELVISLAVVFFLDTHITEIFLHTLILYYPNV